MYGERDRQGSPREVAPLERLVRAHVQQPHGWVAGAGAVATVEELAGGNSHGGHRVGAPVIHTLKTVGRVGHVAGICSA